MIWLLPAAIAVCNPHRAWDLLASRPEIVNFCERCGDRVPGEPHRYAPGEPGQWLATTYLHTEPDRYENLALLVGCSSEGAVPSLHVEHDHGALIVPDDAAVQPLLAAAKEPETHYGLVGGFSALATIGVVLVVRRRRRTHEPRL